MLSSLVEILDRSCHNLLPSSSSRTANTYHPPDRLALLLFLFLDCVPDEESTALRGSEIPPLLQENCGNLAKVCNYLRSCSEIPTLPLEPLLPVLFILSEIHSLGLLN